MRERLIRLWSLVEALTGLRRGLAIRALAERLGVSRATVHRDIGLLRIPIARELHDGEARYRLLGEGLPARQLGSRERLAITIARHPLAELEGTSLIETLDGIGGDELPIGARIRATTRRPRIIRVVDRALRELPLAHSGARGVLRGSQRSRVLEPHVGRIPASSSPRYPSGTRQRRVG